MRLSQIAIDKRERQFAISVSLPPKIVLSLVIISTIVFCALFAPWISPTDFNAMAFSDRLSAPALFTESASPYLLGTDHVGRDVFTRILYGARVSLLVGAVATLIGLAIGVILGVASGYVGGYMDSFIMYLVDVQLSLPFLLLAIAIALVLGNSVPVLIGIAALAIWPQYARVCRAVVLSLRERDYVVAAYALGASSSHITRFHLLPGLVAPVLVLATITVGRVILIESALSFLGIGIKPPTPSWGGMIDEGRDYLATAWWVSTMPGIALTLLIMAIGTVGDWLRDVLDPTLKT